MAGKVSLDISISDYPHTRSILSGEIAIEGVEPNFIRIVPQIGAFRRMVRNHEFDVCELAPTTYMIARAYGAPFVGLPVFLMRQFNHSALLVRPDAGITEPKQLEGHKVGVRAYSVTTGVWFRSILIEDYDVDISRITWVVDDEEHVQAMKLPPNVVHAGPGQSLHDMMAAGELSAGFKGNAGVGRKGSPAGGWQVVPTDYPQLFPHAGEVEAESYRRTGIYPIHGILVVKDKVLADHPWVARSLYDAFAASKAEWLKEHLAGTSTDKLDDKYRKLRRIVGDDPLPYGLQANLPSIEALARTVWDQKLSPRRLSLEEIVVDPEGNP
jgi:4,5-dihydroxyphthalate decarboxylase